MIEKWKNNLAKWGYVPEEMKEWAISTGLDNFGYIRIDGKMGKATDINSVFVDHYRYRLNPDYQPEDEIVETELYWVRYNSGSFDRNVKLPNSDSYWTVDKIKAGMKIEVNGQVYQLLGFRFKEQTGDEIYNFSAGYYEERDGDAWIFNCGDPENFTTANRAAWRRC